MEDINFVASLPLPWEKLKNKSIMLSGATGLIGSFLVDVILEKNIRDNLNCTVYALGRNKEKAMVRFSKNQNNPYLVFIPYDVKLPLVIDNVGVVDYILQRGLLPQCGATHLRPAQPALRCRVRQGAHLWQHLHAAGRHAALPQRSRHAARGSHQLLRR